MSMTSVCLLITIFFHQNITILKDSVCLDWENATINDVKCQLEQNHLLSGNAYKELLAVLGDSEIERSRIELRCDLLNKIKESNPLFFNKYFIIETNTKTDPTRSLALVVDVSDSSHLVLYTYQRLSYDWKLTEVLKDMKLRLNNDIYSKNKRGVNMGYLIVSQFEKEKVKQSKYLTGLSLNADSWVAEVLDRNETL
ncbi:hypothetical protein SIO70_10090 [Chitinophaga sancti]|uniref:hypothetical protein n=1 Tax=Chitinophaga sancti TaxID=1004 RepID=UPI002A75115D|nr:hypothetical protein [Chitinophaga sancti]WPQ65194.1 hypothetical protein SIO70_10090 [Chitinophaga sancti]